jgi:SH3 domain protein
VEFVTQFRSGVDFVTLSTERFFYRTESPPSIPEFCLRLFRSRWASLALIATLSFMIIPASAGPASADTGWVRGNIRLNLRSGAGTKFKILGAIETGDEMEVLGRGENWTRVRTMKDDKVGWIPAGYLETEPPPTLRLAQLETETGTLRSQLEEIRSEASQLRESNVTLASTDSGQREQIESLRIENYELRAGSRYQEWITGALILASGMLLGALLHRNSTRRPSSRIRL